MSSRASRSTEQREELLAERALGGLDPGEKAKLEALLDGEEDLSFDLAAASIDLAHLPADAALPAGLAARIAEQARDHFAGEADPPAEPPRSVQIEESPATVRSSPPREREVEIPRAAPANDATRWAGWALAAAGWAVAAWSWATRPDPATLAPIQSAAPIVINIAVPASPRQRSLGEERAKLLADAKDAVVLPWEATKDPTAQGASGDVVWSDSKQQGYMRFKGLAVNDPERLQYQLWIFDPTQDKRYPVDGGVFDIDAAEADPATGDVIVPIVAKLKVLGPTLFAITVEKPGGVVVSSRERIALVASPKKG